MGRELTTVLTNGRDAICQSAIARVTVRREFAGQPAGLSRSVNYLLDALLASAEAGEARALSARALELGRAGGDARLGYGRLETLLDALCAASADQVRAQLTGESARAALIDLRRLVGPAMLGMAALYRAQAQEGADE